MVVNSTARPWRKLGGIDASVGGSFRLVSFGPVLCTASWCSAIAPGRPADGERIEQSLKKTHIERRPRASWRRYRRNKKQDRHPVSLLGAESVFVIAVLEGKIT